MSAKKTLDGAQARPAQPPTECEPKGRPATEPSLEKEAGEEMDWEKAGEPRYSPQPDNESGSERI
jgi:hypothetical protein